VKILAAVAVAKSQEACSGSYYKELPVKDLIKQLTEAYDSGYEMPRDIIQTRRH
jgi:hypothetical protein